MPKFEIYNLHGCAFVDIKHEYMIVGMVSNFYCGILVAALYSEKINGLFKAKSPPVYKCGKWRSGSEIINWAARYLVEYTEAIKATCLPALSIELRSSWSPYRQTCSK